MKAALSARPAARLRSSTSAAKLQSRGMHSIAWRGSSAAGLVAAIAMGTVPPLPLSPIMQAVLASGNDSLPRTAAPANGRLRIDKDDPQGDIPLQGRA